VFPVLPLIETLSASPHVETVASPDAPARFAAGGESRALAPGEVLFREGEPRRHVFRVETGALCLYRSYPDGSRDILEFAFPGDLIGLGYLDSHVASAQATMETSLSCLPRTGLDPALDPNPGVRGRLTAAIEREVAFLKQSLVEMGRPSPLRRVAALFVTLSRYNAYEGRTPSLITDSLTCGVVSGYLDMSVDELAAHLTELEARGLIEPCDNGLRLKDLNALEALSDGAD
jgi:CRP/FNR family transcriptional regulator, anaerobic regulatory protein